MSEELKLSIQDQKLAERPDVTPGQMLQAMMKMGVTPENVAAVSKMAELYEHMQDREAKRSFAQAFKALQMESSHIKAVKAVVVDGMVRYRFAPYEEIMDAAQPLLAKHGFTITFSSEIEEGRITKICELMHESGHARTNKFSVRIGKGPPGTTETQADGAAHTYAKRGALTDALNIVVDKDADARNLGATISKAQAEDLRRRVKETGSDQARFLKYAQSPDFEQISEAMYSNLDELLRKREKTT